MIVQFDMTTEKSIESDVECACVRHVCVYIERVLD